jgi:TetR/AcrR family transcriptional regulator, transcriptional repressor for nem operon
MVNQKESMKQHILDIGRELVAEHGFSTLGLSSLLKTATVPKGSFYHYFQSKEDFGCELLSQYFSNYFEMMDSILACPNGSAYERLMQYWQMWHDSQSSPDCNKRCLITKLGAEVSDLSENMRVILDEGVQSIISRLKTIVAEGFEDGSIQRSGDAMQMTVSLYQMWIGATLISRISHDSRSLAQALKKTESILTKTNR